MAASCQDEWPGRRGSHGWPVLDTKDGGGRRVVGGGAGTPREAELLFLGLLHSCSPFQEKIKDTRSVIFLSSL